MATAPINIRISPALDPETYRATAEEFGDSARGYVDDVICLMTDVHATLGKLDKARKLADSNPAWTEEQRILIVGAEAAKQKDRLARKLDRAMHDLGARIEQVQGELLKPVQQGAAAGPLAAEVRGHCKSLSNGERSKLIREALAADDESTLQAVLGAAPFLSGMTNVDRDHFIGLYHAKKQPHLVARLELMTHVRDLLVKNGANGPVFHKAFQKIVNAEPGVVSAIEKADTAAREALKIEPTA